jgi:DHA3 family macrolide efflux protein-like MFS transporter
MPLGMLFFGPLADIVSINNILIVTGFMSALLGIPMIASKTLREAGKNKSLKQTDIPSD